MAHGEEQSQPPFMNAWSFIGGAVLIGLLFAFQDWIAMRHMGYFARATVIFEIWGVQFLLLSSICWLLWRFGREKVEQANAKTIFAFFLPLSIAAGITEEMIWVLLFPGLPLNRPHMSYWHRLSFYLYADLLEDIVIFWCAFLLFRGIGYYQRYRENEQVASRLQVQLANAQISALRMQMNPHFLFNAMNGISSLMRTDIDAADTMLEQLSCLMRITLERGDAQLITLRDEMDFAELFLEMQAQRYAGRATQSVSADPELYDAMVPAMILQPILENAYVHGLSKVESGGELTVSIHRNGDCLRICVTNTGPGLHGDAQAASKGHGVGLANIRDRLRLHYEDGASLSIADVDRGRVEVKIEIPLQWSEEPLTLVPGFSREVRYRTQ